MTATITEPITRTITLRLPDRERAVVTLRVTPLDAEHRTVNHDVTAEPTWRVSITGEVFGYRAREAHSAGQVQSSLPEFHPVRLAWERHHLNDMRSHCAHQDAAVRWDETEPCPVTGYKAGSAWLVEPISADDLARLVGLFDSYR